MRARHIEKRLLWQELLVPDVRTRLGRDEDTAPDAWAAALVNAAFGCADAAIQEWIRREGNADIQSLYRDALTTVHPPRGGK
ncbi:hypothetical protein [Streptomyces sp. NPDC051665]|uniref:hypothetical protein n=1 Tax=Streptomyces sp. NPDC051665 TaxID=3154647 RepID=UPI00342E5829